MLGRISYWNELRHYGFITVLPAQEQYFFHASNFDGHPLLSAIVIFQLGDPIAEGKKPQAIGIRFANAEEIRHANVATGAAALAQGRGGAQ